MFARNLFRAAVSCSAYLYRQLASLLLTPQSRQTRGYATAPASGGSSA
jgi:hypothetical protein